MGVSTTLQQPSLCCSFSASGAAPLREGQARQGWHGGPSRRGLLLQVQPHMLQPHMPPKAYLTFFASSLLTLGRILLRLLCACAAALQRQQLPLPRLAPCSCLQLQSPAKSLPWAAEATGKELLAWEIRQLGLGMQTPCSLI